MGDGAEDDGVEGAGCGCWGEEVGVTLLLVLVV
jgi:hypothetical protein